MPAFNERACYTTKEVRISTLQRIVEVGLEGKLELEIKV